MDEGWDGERWSGRETGRERRRNGERWSGRKTGREEIRLGRVAGHEPALLKAASWSGVAL